MVPFTVTLKLLEIIGSPGAQVVWFSTDPLAKLREHSLKVIGAVHIMLRNRGQLLAKVTECWLHYRSYKTAKFIQNREVFIQFDSAYFYDFHFG